MTIRAKFRSLALSAVALLATSTSFGARQVITLADDWQIFSVTDGSGDRAISISLPHCWSLNPDTPQDLTSVNYTKVLYAPEEWRGKRIFLRFGGVNNIADLFVNGVSVGEHRGGTTAFAFEITPQLRYNEDNIIMTRVVSNPQNDILPTSVEHELYGGIYRDVELIVTPKVAISPIFYGTEGVFVRTTSINGDTIKGEVQVKFLTSAAAEQNITLTISDKGGKRIFSRNLPKHKISNTEFTTIPFTLNGAKPWSPESPALYDVTVSTDSVEKNYALGDQSDEVTVTTGFRMISLKPDGKSPVTVSVNETPILFRGVSLYHDNPFTGGVLSERSYRRDLNIIDDMGANAIRSAITPHDKTLYDLCDERGIMVWVDTPLAKSPYLSDVGYFPTPRFKENSLQQMMEIVYQNYNHPSVVMWGLFSLLPVRGSDVLDHLKALQRRIKEIDPTRPTVALSNQNGAINEISDLVVWQQSLGWDIGHFTDISVWSNQLHTRWNHLRSAVMYGEGGSVDHKMDRSEIPMCRIQKRSGWYPEVRQSAQHEAYAAQLSSDSLFWGMWNNAMFDYRAPRRLSGMNFNGLVSFDRNNYKDAFYLYRALWNKDDKTLHIADKRARMVGDGDSLVTLRVYASDGEEEDLPIANINGKEVEMRRVAPAQFQVDSVRVTGRTNVVVTHGKLKDSVEFIYGSPLRNRKR